MKGLLIFVVFMLICLSLCQYLFTRQQTSRNSPSLEVFFSLCFVYCTVIIGFAIIYFLCAKETTILDNLTYNDLSVLEQLYECIYFSGVTMLTIGYGDISPVGIGRSIALIQALIGYILPTAFVLKLMQMRS